MILLFILPYSVLSQDKIYKRDNTIIEAKINTILDKDSVIQYHRADNLEGPVYNIRMRDIKMIVYKNGYKEIYHDDKPASNTSINSPTQQIANPNPQKAVNTATESAKDTIPKPIAQTMESLLLEYSSYFSKTEIIENGNLIITPNEKYWSLSENERTAILTDITSSQPKSIIVLHNKTKTELWAFGKTTSKAQLLDNWDLNNINETKKTPTVLRPWFIYVGGQLGYSKIPTNVNINITGNVRIGFFMVKNIWDLAATASGGITSNQNSKPLTGHASEAWSSLGLMTRLHLPIRSLGISPYIGVELGETKFGDADPVVNTSYMIGFGWFMGFGTLDIGFKITPFSDRDVTYGAGMAGLSLAPGLNKR